MQTIIGGSKNKKFVSVVGAGAKKSESRGANMVNITF
jgi:hypothetical protein